MVWIVATVMWRFNVKRLSFILINIFLRDNANDTVFSYPGGDSSVGCTYVSQTLLPVRYINERILMRGTTSSTSFCDQHNRGTSDMYTTSPLLHVRTAYILMVYSWELFPIIQVGVTLVHDLIYLAQIQRLHFNMWDINSVNCERYCPIRCFSIQRSIWESLFLLFFCNMAQCEVYINSVMLKRCNQLCLFSL